MTTVEYLRAAKALIVDPANWRQGWPDHLLNDDFPRDPRLCADIALWRVGCRVGHPAEYALARAMGWDGDEGAALFIWVWNDSHSHVEVMAAFDRAISFEQSLADEDVWRCFIPSDTDLVMTPEGDLTYA